jgi:PhzF family phenazine biosynthesis protein
VDAFAERQFSGNPAAVCPLTAWLPDAQMQAIAAENNLAETAFFVAQDDLYQLRWFTPEVEVDLCGHATLAAAHVLWTELGVTVDSLRFDTRSGLLTVSRNDGLITLDFPAEPPQVVEPPEGLFEAIGAAPELCLYNQDYVLVFSEPQQVTSLAPDFRALANIDARGVIATAPHAEYDFICRFFGPAVGIDEDPVTGSAYTKLIPYWANRLKKSTLSARQVSTRGGDVWCQMSSDRVLISGHACTYLRGTVRLNSAD